jgi:integrase/recombinase XerD
MTLERYLRKQHTEQTARMYLRDIRFFLDYMTEEKAIRATYQDILQYVEYLRKQYSNARTINRMLYGVKAWYLFLFHKGIRKDHPCRFLKLRDAKNEPVQLQDLFSPAELEQLMNRKERYESLRIRNQVIISVLIYQALRLSEIVNLKVQDVNLEEGTVYIRETPRSVSRTLKLRSNQVMILYKYIHEIRSRVIKTESDQLVLTIRGTEENGEGINYLAGTFKNLFPDRNMNAQTIRQSVIANMLKTGKDLRVVQAFAGHKKPSSTEKYRQTGLEELKSVIQKLHPLG